jgi:predicted HicB family RNase H-like nuclease
MKRIVNGVTYNTATSTLLATFEWEHKDHNGGVTEEGTDLLYQTRGGAFFLHEEKTAYVWDENEREMRQRERNEFTPLSPEGAHKWMLEGDIEVLNNPFDDPPEAEAEAEAGATIYIRVPAALKRRVDEAAKAEGVSGNLWAMRCIERCLGAEPDAAKTAPTTGASSAKRNKRKKS